MTETIAGSLLFLRLESTAERKRRGPAKTGPAVDPVAVSASPRRVGRSVGSTPRFGRDCWPQGQPHSTAYSETWAKTPRPKRPRSGRSTWPTRRERDARARKTASRGAPSQVGATPWPRDDAHGPATPLSAVGATASDIRTTLWILGFSGLTAATVLLLRTVAQSLPGSSCAASDSAVLQRVERDGERDQQPAVDALHAGTDLEHVAVAQLAEHALVTGGVLAVTDQHEVERQPRQNPHPVWPEVREAAQQRDDPAGLVGVEELVAVGVDDLPVAAQQRAAEQLPEPPDHTILRVEHIMAPAELENRLRLDHEDVRPVLRPRPEADVLLDLHALLLHEQHGLALLDGARRRHTDPVLVRYRLEHLPDPEAVPPLDRG